MTVWDYLERRWDTVFELAIEHLFLVLGSVLIATVIGVGLGLLVHNNRQASTTLIAVVNTAFTVPSLAYFSVFVVWFGLGLQPSVLTLVIYALLPIVRNTVTGLGQVDQAIVRAATGMGMGRGQALLRIELPLALPVIMTGVRIGAVLTVGVAAVAAYVGGPGLGREIFGGLGAIGSARGVPQAIVGTVAVIVVTLLIDALMAASNKLVTPKGLR